MGFIPTTPQCEPGWRIDPPVSVPSASGAWYAATAAAEPLDASKQAEQPNEIDVAVTASGQILINKSPLTATDVKSISDALRRAAGTREDPIIVINADAKATHQSVIDVMQGAQVAGYPHISFATQAPR